MRPTRTLRILLAVALLAVWQGALLHPLQHVDAKGAFVHVAGKDGSRAPGDKGSSTPLCIAIAAVSACVSGGAPLALAAVHAPEAVAPRDAPSREAAPRLAYRSQGPPPLV